MRVSTIVVDSPPMLVESPSVSWLNNNPQVGKNINGQRRMPGKNSDSFWRYGLLLVVELCR
jgi:hypothetical protein